MLNKKNIFIWIIIVAAVIIASAFLLSNKQTISLIDTDIVIMLDMEQFNEGLSMGLITVTDREKIEIVLLNLSGAIKTMRITVNDYPIQDNYLVVRLISEKERQTMCLYSDGGSYYVEEPYVGVYKNNRDANAAIYSVYTG